MPASRSSLLLLDEGAFEHVIGRDGAVLERYAPTTKPDAIAADIERALG
ncbi:hypothetical protein [Xanthomonas cucurbitae]